MTNLSQQPSPSFPGRLLRRSSRRYLRQHPLLILLSILGVAVGVSVVVGIDLANSSARTAFQLSTETVAGRATHALVAGDGPIDDDIYQEVRVGLGVRQAAPILEGYARVSDPTGPVVQLLGIDPLADGDFRSFAGGPGGGLDLGGFMGGSSSVLMAPATASRFGLEIGSSFFLWVDGRAKEVTLLDMLDPSDDLEATGLDNLIVMDISVAQAVMDAPGQLSRIDLRLPLPIDVENMTALVEDRLPENVELRRAEARSSTLDQMTEAFSLNLTAMSLLALVVGMFLIYNTMTFSVVQRRSLMGRLRALGVTRREIFWLVLSEALLIGGIGAIIGVLGGVALGRVLVGLVTQTINDLYFVVRIRDLDLSYWALAKGLLLGIGSTLLSTIPPAREATRAAVSTVLRRSENESRISAMLPRLNWSGLGLAVLGGLLLWGSGTNIAVSYVGILAIILAGACWTPALVLLGSRLLRPVLGGVFGIIGRMAASGIGQSLSRSAVAVAALTIAVSATTGVGVMVESFRTTVDTWLTYSLEADVYISPPGTVFRRNDSTITPEAEAVIRSADGVISSFSVRTANVVVDNEPTDLIVTEPRPSALEPGRYKAIADYDHREAMRSRDVVMVSEPYSYRHGTRVGDELLIVTANGPIRFEVGAIYHDYASDLGAVQMTRSRYDIHFNDPFVSGLAVYVAPSDSVETVVEQLREATTSVQGLNIRSNRDLRQASLEVFDRTFTVTTVLRLLAILVAFVGVLTALMSLQLERRRELAVLRANGMTPVQVRRTVTLQTVSMGLIAGILSIPMGLVLSWLLIFVINQRSFGWTLQFIIDPMILGQAVLLALLAALLASVYPAWSMSRANAADALRAE